MKKTILIVLIGVSSVLKAQDSTAVKVSEIPAPKKFSHEIAFNGTFLIKQLFLIEFLYPETACRIFQAFLSLFQKVGVFKHRQMLAWLEFVPHRDF